MQVGSLVEWQVGGEVEEGYGIVLEINDKYIIVYWLRIEDETHLTLADGIVKYPLNGADVQNNNLVEVVCE